MRLLTTQEVSDVAGGSCPFCVMASVLLMASASSTIVGFFCQHINYYVTGGVLLTLSAATSLKIYSSEKKLEHSHCTTKDS